MNYLNGIVLLLIIVCTPILNAQVGINTRDPKEAVDVSGGDNAIIRVDGLSKANNPNNFGDSNATRVYVDDNGDLVLSPSVQNLQLVVNAPNYLDDNNGGEINQTGGGSAYSEAGEVIAGAEFTLIRDAMIQISYSVSWSIKKNNNSKISDGRARIIQTGIFFKDVNNNDAIVTEDLNGKPINPAADCNTAFSQLLNCLGTEGLLGLSGQFYNNSSTVSGASKGFHNTGNDYVRLPAGTYIAYFAGQVSVGDTKGSGNIQFELGTGLDELQIIAYYY